MADTRSAKACTGALDICACCTSLTICDRTVSDPTRVARMSSKPLPLLMVPPISGSPLRFHTALGSPVIIASFTNVSPESTVPSVGMRPPGRT